jgi:hypothetical protein
VRADRVIEQPFTARLRSHMPGICDWLFVVAQAAFG